MRCHVCIFESFNISSFFQVRRKIKIALFPLTCRRRGRVGRSENLFIFRVFFSFLKIGKKVETC